jgi:hypothetical protein
VVRPSPRRDRLLWLLGGAASAVLLAQTWTRAHRAGGIDLTTYLEAAKAVERGGSPYALPVAFPYIYPPFLAFALIPLTHLPRDLVLVVWFAASIGAIVWSLRAVVRAGLPQVRARPLTPFFAVLIAALYPVFQSNLRNGQVNFFVTALAVAALVGSGDARRGVAWGVATAIKVMPAAVAPFFVRRLQWRVGAAAVAALVLVCLVPVLALGAALVPLTMQYGSSFLGSSFRVAWSASSIDFSMGGVLTRTSGVDSEAVRRLATALPLVAVFAVDLFAPRTSSADARLFSMYLAAIPLASPKSEVHHLAFALPAAAIALGAVWFGVDRRRWLLLFLAVSAAAYAAAIASTPWSGLFWFSALVALLCAMTAGTLARE